jgi:hypothetical protein
MEYIVKLPPEWDFIYGVAQYCKKSKNENLGTLGFKLQDENLRKEQLDNLMLDIADIITGYPDFTGNGFWTRDEHEALDLAYDIYRNFLRDPPPDRITLCAYLEETLYDSGANEF